jgi:DNA-binding NtrC family response regulator
MFEPNVLLVDDEAPFVDTMTKRLTKRNLNVKSALSGEAALEALKADSHIDVVILDVKMPGMDGVETLKEIRKSFPLVEVIMLTGHATVETSIEGMRQGAFDYLMKPCEMDVLMEKVTAAGKKKRDHEEKIREARVSNILKSRT